MRTHRAGNPVPPAPVAQRVILVIVPPGSGLKRTTQLLQKLRETVRGQPWRIDVLEFHEEGPAFSAPAVLQRILDHHPHAIVFSFPALEHLELTRLLVREGLPVITYNRDFSETGAMGVVCDVRDVAQVMFDQLWKMGKRRFAAIAVDKPSPSIRQFVQTVTDRVRAHGVEHQYRKVILPYTNMERPTDAIMQIIHETMTAPDRPDAILCAEFYSLIAVETWLAINNYVQIPEHVAVASFERPPRAHLSRLLGNLPGGDMDTQKMMETAVEMIDLALAGEVVDPPVRAIPAVVASPPPKQ